MSKDGNIPTVTNRSKLAAFYGVSIRVFNDWIERNGELKELFKPFLEGNKRVLPPYVFSKVVEVLGEP